MIKVRPLSLTVLLSLLFAGLAPGDEKPGFELTPTGNASMEFGNIVKGYDKNYGIEPFSNVWMEKVIIGFGMQAVFSPKDTFRAAAEMKMFNEFPRTVDYGATRRLYHYPYVREAQAIHNFIENGTVKIDGGAGYFPYKYNANVRNLGEYLFRSTAYPQTLSTEFDYPYARLLGGYAKATLFDQVRCDILIASNQEYMAIHDVNAAALGSWNFRNIFEVGAGVFFGSILSADSNFTSPKNNSSAYVDTANGTDTLFYTFAGNKLMARLSFDPKRLMTSDGFGGFLGEQDLKIYTEATMLGTKSYPRAFNSPIWYMSPLERIPVMLGFNFPTFKLFDVLSCEAEWWGNRFPNSLQGIVIDGLPIPFASGTSVIDSMKYKSDNWKWSIYGKRTFADHYQLIWQVASDHMRTFALEWSRQDWEESLRGPSNFYYVVKFGVLF